MTEEEGLVAHLTNRLELGRELDDLIEEAQSKKSPLSVLLDRLLPHLLTRLGASHLILETRDESLEQRTFEIGRQAEGESLRMDIDLAGEKLGFIEVTFDTALEDKQRERINELLETGIEVLDNYLKTIQTAREKHFLTRQLHQDLLHQLADEGIKQAVETLKKAVEFELLVVVYHQANAYEQSVRYLVFRGAGLAFDSQSLTATDVLENSGSGLDPKTIVKQATQRFNKVKNPLPGDLRDEQGTREFLLDLGFDNYVETLLCAGLRDSTVLGKVVVAGSRELSTYERDLVATFADALQKRVIDYDRESRQLNRTFNVPTVLRLLRSENYQERFLTPRKTEAAIMFTDISGFTKISEQILGDAVKIGKFIQSWGEEVVQILWRNGGACDKFVGDCLIGLFGPPFFDHTPQQICISALKCAVEISRFTRAFQDDPSWRAISNQAVDLGVATGLNYCPVSLGSFGLNCGYTAFASGVNNTARLQGVAKKHEILVMESMVDLLKDSEQFKFSSSRQELVKNVKDPLVFSALEWEGSPR